MKSKYLVLIIVIQLLACSKETEPLMGSFIGKVKMNQGNDLSVIKVELKNKSLKYETLTDIEGIFYFDQLARGSYNITVSKEGYDTIRHTELIIGNGKPNVKEFYLSKSETVIAISTP